MSAVSLDPDEIEKIKDTIKSKRIEIIYNPMIDTKSLKKGEWVIGRPPTSFCRWIDPNNIEQDIALEIKDDLEIIKDKRKKIIYTIYGFVKYKLKKEEKIIIYYDKITERI
jgi:hypothetical protein